jgi:hypothetical protein
VGTQCGTIPIYSNILPSLTNLSYILYHLVGIYSKDIRVIFSHLLVFTLLILVAMLRKNAGKAEMARCIHVTMHVDFLELFPVE